MEELKPLNKKSSNKQPSNIEAEQALIGSILVNNDIIENGVNGFLCNGEDQWFNVLSELIENDQLRKQIGNQGRKTVVNKYSTLSQRDNYLNLYLSLINKQ